MKNRATARRQTPTMLPIAAPAMAPALSLSLPFTDGSAEPEVGSVVESVEDGLDDAPPSAVRLAYGPQSELGTASGQEGSWHKDRSCGPCWGLNVTGRAHRELYMLFMRVFRACASAVEKP